MVAVMSFLSRIVGRVTGQWHFMLEKENAEQIVYIIG
jgi:hypothetical protein